MSVKIENFEIRKVEVSDYKELLDFMKIVMGETDYLSRSSDEFKMTYEDEKKFLEEVKASDVSEMFIAFYQGKQVGNIIFRGNELKRARHYGNIGISVLKEYWGNNIGSKLIDRIIEWAKENGIKKINLEVFENNERAIKLYERKGFKLEGNIEMARYVNGEYKNLLIYGLIV
ncbi:MAG: GNAT family N-acetyltransferase [Fusobacterium gastrosuis]|uniref:GNAT family N-acetyltransferase n=1 Tax=Fusobacterium gastrosuis TaxID=1755100 RepID=UPI002A86D27F|nr:GNAT family N-acetyltransferase [Fusobacterium gastrosuis]MDY5795199.1 GNAT family N-acetyltransferase [Fusobacterium gastrosuis]